MGRRWVSIALGVVFGAVLTLGMVNLAGKPKRESDPVVQMVEALPEPVELSKGTPVEFVLLDPLNSGGTGVGELATIVVLSDVMDAGGKIAVPAGAVAQVEVVRSREASVMTSLANQPARLSVRFLPMEVEGVSISLATSEDALDSEFEIIRGSVGREEASEALIALWGQPEMQEFLTALSARLNGEGDGALDDEQSVRIMKEVSEKLELSATQEATRSKGLSVGALVAMGQRADDGKLKAMDPAEVLLAVRALAELGGVVDRVDRGLRGTFKGRNISAPIGTRLTAYVSEDVKFVRN